MPRLTTALLTGLLTTLVAVAPATALAASAPPEDPNLDQTLESDQPIVHGEHTLDSGHVDMGPRFDEGEWRFLVHDDAAKDDESATSVWRYPDETVMHAVDAAAVEVPDDPAYEFLGAEPGKQVWVVPQTQDTEVVWLGWNTQDPEVMQRIDRGVTLSLTGVQGPGDVNVYLQSGSFGEPEVLWDSRSTEEQPLWVDVNTHTHANWVFTEPGVYLLQLRADADLIDGSSVSDTQVVRFAVGSQTTPADALAAQWEGGTGEAGDAAAADASADEGGWDTDQLVPILVAALGVLVVALIVVVIGATVRNSRTKRRVLEARQAKERTTVPTGGRSEQP